MRQTTKISRKTMAAISAAAIVTLTGSVGAGVAAAAEDSPDVVAPATGQSEPTNPPLSSIPTEGLSLTVHKYSEPCDVSENRSNSGGREYSDKDIPTKAQPITGVRFKIRKFKDIDLTTNLGWQAANKIRLAYGKENFPSTVTVGEGDAAQTVSTALVSDSDAISRKTVNGVATFNNLPLGLYEVEELYEKDASLTLEQRGEQTEKTITAEQLVRAPKFVVAVPLTDPDERQTWMRNIHVYPKNGITSVEKSVNDETAVGAGNQDKENTSSDSSSAGDAQGQQVLDKSTITYTIRGEIPGSSTFAATKDDEATSNLKRFSLVDPLDPRLTYLKTTKVRIVVKNDQGQWEPRNLPASFAGGLKTDTHYTISADPDNKEGANADKEQVITLDFNEEGLKALNSVQGAYVEWSFETKLHGLTEPSTIPNKGFVLVNNPGTKWDREKNPGGETPEVESKYGQVTLKKFEVGNPDKKLSATFELFQCTQENNKWVTGKQIYVNGEKQWTTAESGENQGTVTITGLQLNNFRNGKKITEQADITHYCLVEVKAPQGYEGLVEPLEFQLLDGEGTSATLSKTVDIPNVPANAGFNLPLTGGSGVIPLVGFGALLVIGAGGYAAYASRRHHVAVRSN